MKKISSRMGHEDLRIVVVKLGSIGDCVHTLPLIAVLRRSFPKACLAWVVEEKAKEIPSGQEGIDEVIVVDTRQWRRLLKSGKILSAYRAIRFFQKQLSDYRFDVAIDGQGLIKSGLITLLTGAPTRIGFSWGFCRERLNTLFTTHRVVPTGAHVVQQNLSLLDGLSGVDRRLQVSEKPAPFDFTLSRGAVDRVAQWWNEMGIGQDTLLVALHPGAGFETKRWPLERFLELADYLMEREGLQVVVTLGEPLNDLERLLSGKRKRPMIAPSLNLKELAALYRRCRVVVAGDTGPLHLAAAVGCPTLGLFGPSEARRSGPFYRTDLCNKQHRVVQGHCICRGESPYFPRHCHEKIGCMEGISVEEVYDAVKEILGTV